MSHLYPVRLLVYCGATEWGGAEIVLGHLLTTLSDRYEVRLLGVDDTVLERLAARRPGITHTVLPPVRGRWDLAAARAHRRAMARAGADLVHLNLSVPYADPYTVLGATTLRHTPTVAVVHLPMPSPGPRLARIVRFNATRTTAVVGVSAGSARPLEQVLGLPPGRVRVVWNGVPTPRGSPLPVAAPPGRLVVGAVGRLDRQKGFDVLMRAIADLPAAHLVLIGDGPEWEALEALATDLGLKGRVTMAGWSDEAPTLMRSFDVLAVPSRWEGLPLVVLEAMLGGVPVVATPVGGIPDAVRHEETGLLVEVEDPAGLAAALNRLGTDPALRRRLAAAAAAEAARRFTVEAMTRSFEALHHEILSRRAERSLRRPWGRPRPGEEGGSAVPSDAQVAAVPAGGPWPVLAPPPAAAGVNRAAGPPSFSVVIAAHQAEATIAAAVASALEQTHPPLEVVVCDDGSIDGTADVLASLGDTVRVVRQPNRGESAAKNAAVAAARGDYVVVLDADDVFHPRRLEALAWFAQERPDLDVITTDAIVEADGVPVRRAYHSDWSFPADDQRVAILDRNFILGMCAVPRKRWLEVGGFDESLSITADWEFWQRMVLDGSPVGLVDAPLARYRLTYGTLSSDPVRMTEARLQVLDRATARTDLDRHEREVLARARIRAHGERRWRLLAHSLGENGRDVRRHAFAVFVGRQERLRTRLGALLAVVAPGLARRRRLRRLGDTVEIGSGIRVPRRN
ncbi:glycosyltransferase [Geodermatophilus obscurus]|uniref:Glycosyl transferase group 1 n=1 Tax=Geodermatophilus obscurus (strain ATCC 25078 / DSM 43160 / JCM 3152 / CCUG 61914 / KCC A-0152 / KCTC 9177 / NBRC 13315 / NRRL B-3577 / G-20) TaxID=526225 RepID=D2S533_GEOOG|nr:glycosyltransferase [Geodermatophilus obscurus]ADB73144.1 glycosyl transferase group 1 [Geodermatophilus obscurus DSM 43160]